MPKPYNTEPVSRDEYHASAAATMLEKPFQEGVIDLAQKLGWKVYHTYNSRRSQKGYPDLTLVHAQNRRLMFRELKTMKGTTSKEQREWIGALRAAGHDADVWRPVDWFSGRIRTELEQEPQQTGAFETLLEQLAIDLRPWQTSIVKTTLAGGELPHIHLTTARPGARGRIEQILRQHERRTHAAFDWTLDVDREAAAAVWNAPGIASPPIADYKPSPEH